MTNHTSTPTHATADRRASDRGAPSTGVPTTGVPTNDLPNHHAHHPGFAGLRGWVGALSMVRGREPIARLAADLVAVGPGDHLVDVGCGPGAAVREAARRGARATGVDPSDVMLRTARWTSRRRDPARVVWVEGTAELLPLADGDASVLWSLSTVHHWSDVERGLAEAARVLGAGGRLLAIERHRHPDAHGLASHGWTDAQAHAFADLAAAAGFADPEVTTHPLGGGLVLAVRAHRPATQPEAIVDDR